MTSLSRTQVVTPFVLCACGCGRPTLLAAQKQHGINRGEPLRYLHGHTDNGKREKRHPFRLYKVLTTTGCWEWFGEFNDDGYGKTRWGGEDRLAHRWMYEILRKPIDSQLELDHLCRYRACVCPAHMEEVTHTENVRRGLHTKLNREIVEYIRNNPDRLSGAELGRKFDITKENVYRILKGGSWNE